MRTRRYRHASGAAAFRHAICRYWRLPSISPLLLSWRRATPLFSRAMPAAPLIADAAHVIDKRLRRFAAYDFAMLITLPRVAVYATIC